MSDLYKDFTNEDGYGYQFYKQHYNSKFFGYT